MAQGAAPPNLSRRDPLMPKSWSQNIDPNASACPECGAPWSGVVTCRDHFYQFLYWENEDPSVVSVHHLMVLCYHLQHPSLYSPDGLAHARMLLHEFVANGVSPQEMRHRQRAAVDSGQRGWKVKGTPGARGAYDRPIPWTMTAADVAAGGLGSYVENIRAWAQSIYAALHEGQSSS